MTWERLVFKVEAVTWTEAKGLLQTVQHLDPKWWGVSEYVIQIIYRVF